MPRFVFHQIKWKFFINLAFVAYTYDFFFVNKFIYKFIFIFLCFNETHALLNLSYKCNKKFCCCFFTILFNFINFIWFFSCYYIVLYDYDILYDFFSNKRFWYVNWHIYVFSLLIMVWSIIIGRNWLISIVINRFYLELLSC